MKWLKELFGRKEPEPFPEIEPGTVLPESERPQIPSFTEIGGSPTPGLILRRVLRGHTDKIRKLAWSPDGKSIASPSSDQTIRIWDATDGECKQVLMAGNTLARDVAWSPDGSRLASAEVGGDGIYLWLPESGERQKVLQEHAETVCSVAWSRDNRRLASASDDKTVRIWDADSGNCLRILQGHSDEVNSVAWSPDERWLASASHDRTLRIWDPASGESLRTLEGHKNLVFSVAWSPDGKRLASASSDNTIRLWEAESGKPLQILEGHSKTVVDAEFSPDGRWLASKSQDNTVRLWRCDTWECVAIIPEKCPENQFWTGIAFHPRLPLLATLGEKDTLIRIWELDEALLLGTQAGIAAGQKPIHYTTAKLVLVGDSGVGKTGLGWRLAKGEFKEQSSTHGQQFWAIPQLGLSRKDGAECEAVLWDLAGQQVYRQVHSIFLDNIAAALVLFDPGNRQEPLKGAQFWLEQLKGKAQLPPALLVGAREDRGTPAISRQELEQFCDRQGILGGYVGTSALSGQGLDELMERLKALIPWDDMAATVTTATFKRIKEHVLSLKEKPDRRGVLVSPTELRERLEASDMDWPFTDAEMLAAVGHLETHGFVAILLGSAGEKHILLAPELLATLAASIVLLADKNPKELGAVSEAELLGGQHPFEELKGLVPDECQILLDAAVLRFLQHNICFRETYGDDTLLIFPGLIKQKRPLQDDAPAEDGMSYIVRGRVENLYAMLVVLLGYTPSFSRINQWQNQAQYEMGSGEICGFRLIEDREGEIELVLYYGEQLPRHGRDKFLALFEQFLYQRDVEATRFPPVLCPREHRQERATVVKRVREGKASMFCEECGAETALPKLDKGIGFAPSPWLQREAAAANLRSAYEARLSYIKSYRRGWANPRCFLSRVSGQEEWAAKLTHDLLDAGVHVVEQAGHVLPEDTVIVLDSRAYQSAFSAGLLALDELLVRGRLGKRNLVSLGLEGRIEPHGLEECEAGNFADPTHYPLSLYDLVLTLYAIPLNHAAFVPHRKELHEQWEQNLAGKTKAEGEALKIFISYAHEDEPHKNDLMDMLAVLKRRGVVQIWQDREIREGDEWLAEINNAMSQCELALLLVSSAFIRSRFIQEKEVPELLERRKKQGLVVVPIILDHCLWESDPVLGGLQALPTDAEPIVGFDRENGERSRVWKEIAEAIEKRASEKLSR